MVTWKPICGGLVEVLVQFRKGTSAQIPDVRFVAFWRRWSNPSSVQNTSGMVPIGAVCNGGAEMARLNKAPPP